MDTQNILKKAAERCGATRVRYKERNMPTSVDGVVVFPFFGDRRSSFILSSILLRRIKEEQKASKYFVMISWPGMEGLYPYVDEYWQVEDESSISRLKSGQEGFDNSSSFFSLMNKELNQYFYDILGVRELHSYYSCGITKEFFERFKHVKVSLPSIPSGSSLGSDVYRNISQHESKVFFSPCREAFCWRNGSVKAFPVPIQFWKDVASKLHSSGFFPVIFSEWRKFF